MMAFVKKFKFWIALALPVLLAALAFLFGFRGMVAANNAKTAEVDTTIKELGDTNNRNAVPPARWVESFAEIPEELKELDEHVASVLHRPPSYLGVGDVRDWFGFLQSLVAKSTPGQARVWAALSPDVQTLITERWRVLESAATSEIVEVVPEEEKHTILAALNALLDREGLYDKDTFAGVRRGIDEKKAALEKTEGQDQARAKSRLMRLNEAQELMDGAEVGALNAQEALRLNRILLEESFPGFIALAEERRFFDGFFERKGFKAPLNQGIWLYAYHNARERLVDYARERFVSTGEDLLAMTERARRRPVGVREEALVITEEEARRRRQKAERDFRIKESLVRVLSAHNPVQAIEEPEEGVEERPPAYEEGPLYPEPMPMPEPELEPGEEEGEEEEEQKELFELDDYLVPVLAKVEVLPRPERILHHSDVEVWEPVGFRVTLAMRFYRLDEVVSRMLASPAGFQITGLDVARYPRVARYRDRPTVHPRDAAGPDLGKRLVDVVITGYVKVAKPEEPAPADAAASGNEGTGPGNE